MDSSERGAEYSRLLVPCRLVAGFRLLQQNAQQRLVIHADSINFLRRQNFRVVGQELLSFLDFGSVVQGLLLFIWLAKDPAQLVVGEET